MKRKLLVRKFYEREIVKFLQANEEPITDLRYKQEIASVGYGSENLGSYFPRSPSCLRLNVSENRSLPTIFLDACDRIDWYMQNSLGNISIVEIIVEQKTTYAILVSGYVDDGWDNGGNWLEVWDEGKRLVGSMFVPTLDYLLESESQYYEGERYEKGWDDELDCDTDAEQVDYNRAFKWRNRPLQSYDFSVSPPWSEDEQENCYC